MSEDIPLDELYLVLGEPPKRIEDAVNNSIDSTIHKLQGLFPNRGIQTPKVLYDLEGHTAGWAIGGHTIRLNLNLLLNPDHFQDMIDRTVPHEICHIVDVQMHGSSSHGYRWKYLMYHIGLEPTRCHSYETVAARKRKKMPKDQIYYCACGEHGVTIILHRRMLQGKRYYCKRCGETLRPEE
jgi:SprT protein